ncbi:methyltransferase [Duganella violaceipulchra]|uniref:Methyltransferase domain-containing protein n=1 Tax=Duganella violaceipulchra TaxID=2849652 RepID=A0AA41H3U8_9BURK|nr:methyltransferase [Duganella violaceicalia]MBV6320613.1 methyltransferase domain-containing protein [Duganella violaceicalia]MCP2008678.1 release factor glutamine methyltransferase [Duganella violaceicalia]
MDNSPGKLAHIDRWQKDRQKAFKIIPDDGKTFRYLGKEFHVFPNTFWPYTDSQPLVSSLRVKPGNSVLDVGTGSGVIAVFACYGGAARVLAVDINPAALKSALHNAAEHGFGETMEVRYSCLFDGIGDEQFDVITANLPFRNKEAPDVVARSQWDTDFRTNTQFFQQVGKYLKPDGRIYFAHSNFGAVKEVRKLAKENGYSMRMVARARADETKEFYAFLIKRLPHTARA